MPKTERWNSPIATEGWLEVTDGSVIPTKGMGPRGVDVGFFVFDGGPVIQLSGDAGYCFMPPLSGLTLGVRLGVLTRL